MYCTRRLLSFQWDESKPQKRQSHRRGITFEQTTIDWNGKEMESKKKKKKQNKLYMKKNPIERRTLHITLVMLVFCCDIF